MKFEHKTCNIPWLGDSSVNTEDDVVKSGLFWADMVSIKGEDITTQFMSKLP